MPQVSVEINGEVKTGPSENLSALLKAFPNAKVLGLQQQSLLQKGAMGVAKELLQPSFTPPSVRLAGAIPRLSQPGFELLKKAKKTTEEIAPQLAQRGVPPSLAAGIATIPRVALEALPASLTEAGLQLAAGPLSKAVVGLGKFAVQKAFPSIFSTFSGAASEAFRIAATKIPSPIKKELLDPITSSKILEETKNALVQRRRELGGRIGKIVDAVNARFKNNPIIPTADLAGNAEKALTDSFGEISPQAKSIVSKLKTNEGNLTFKQSFDLKHDLQELISFGSPDVTGQRLIKVRPAEESKLKVVLNKLNERMVATFPKFGTANKAFSEMARSMDEARSLLLQTKDPQSQAMSLFKKGGRARFLLEQIDKKLPNTAKFFDALENVFVTEQLSPVIPPSFPRTGALPFLLTGGFLGVGSPRLTGAITRGAGVAGRAAAPFVKPAVRTAIPATRSLFGGR